MYCYALLPQNPNLSAVGDRVGRVRSAPQISFHYVHIGPYGVNSGCLIHLRCFINDAPMVAYVLVVIKWGIDCVVVGFRLPASVVLT